MHEQFCTKENYPTQNASRSIVETLEEMYSDLCLSLLGPGATTSLQHKPRGATLEVS